MAAGGRELMDYGQHASITSSTDEFTARPRFVRKKELQQYTCGICKDILLQPHQTVCGFKVCKSCIDAKFEGRGVVPCPLPHGELDEDELQKKACQQGGLRYAEHVVPDPDSQHSLLKEECFCKNFDFGCRERPIWEKLKDHEAVCQSSPFRCPNPGCLRKDALQSLVDHKADCGFQIINCSFCNQPFRRKVMEDHQARCAYAPTHCPNDGCGVTCALRDLDEHRSECEFAPIDCVFCKQACRRKDMEEHINECEFADSQCTKCSKRFDRRKQLMIHQRIEPACLVSAGKCYYYGYCKFTTDNINQLANHLRTEKDLHLQSVTFKYHELEEKAREHEQWLISYTKKMTTAQLRPLERFAVRIAVDVRLLKDAIDDSETQGKTMEDAVRAARRCVHQQDESIRKLKWMANHIEEAKQYKQRMLNLHTNELYQQDKIIEDVVKCFEETEYTIYNGVMLWKIGNYKKKKSDAVRELKTCIHSSHFYTSTFGYKMCCRAYINGEGPGKSRCFSLFFILMRSDYDELLEFPFKQKVTLTLLSLADPSQNKVESFVPDPESSSFQRPQTEMNTPTGYPQFALHSEIESKKYLVADSLYFKIEVEVGGEIFR